jgi:hypothetical protein
MLWVLLPCIGRRCKVVLLSDEMKATHLDKNTAFILFYFGYRFHIPTDASAFWICVGQEADVIVDQLDECAR